MNQPKRILAIILVLITTIGLFTGTWYLLGQGKNKFDTKNLYVFEDNNTSYYLKRVDQDIVFKLKCDKGVEFDFTLVDEEGNEIQAKTRKTINNCYKILPPADGYSAGKQYTLSLANGVSFHSEELQDARSLVFSIDKEKIESYEFTDTVVQVDSVVANVENDTLDVNNLNVNTGDIIFGQDANDEYVVYKVADIDEGGIASVTVPAVDEIYSDLELYGEYTWDVEDIVSNPDIEIEIIENFKQSSFFESLMITAYADDAPNDAEFDVKIKPNKKDNSIAINIKMTLLPGENGLFGISTLKNQKVGISLNTVLDLTTLCDFESVKDWDISASLTNEFSWSVDLTFINKEIWEKDSDLEGLFSKENKFANLIDYHKNAKIITEKLNNLSADVTAGEIKLFDWKLPVPAAPGLYFNAEIRLFTKANVAANATVSSTSKTVYVVGMYYKNGNFKAYSNTSKESNGITLSLSGKANIKTGIKFVMQANFIHEKVGYIRLDPQVGVYTDAYITYPVSKLSEIKDKSFPYGYCETGGYFSANVSASLNLLLKKVEFSYELAEKKDPFEALTFGNKEIAMGIISKSDTVQATDMSITVPDILLENFDVTKGAYKTTNIPVEDLEFTTNDGVKLKAANGKITLPTSSEESMDITVTYSHANGQTYSAVFRALLSESSLAGMQGGSPIIENIEADSITYINRRIYENDPQGPYYCFIIQSGDKYGVIDTDGNYLMPMEEHYIYYNSRLNKIAVGGNPGYVLNSDGTLEEETVLGYGSDFNMAGLFWDSSKNSPVYLVVDAMSPDSSNITEYEYSKTDDQKLWVENDSIKFITLRTNVEKIPTGIWFYDMYDSEMSKYGTYDNEPVDWKYGLFDGLTDTLVTDFIYDEYKVINDNLAFVKTNNQWRLMDRQGNYVDDIVYDSPCDIDDEYNDYMSCNGYFIVKINDKLGLYNDLGQVVVEPIYNNISGVNPDGYYWAQVDNGTWSLFKLA